MDEQDRRRVLESAEQTDHAIAKGAVAVEARSPADSSRLIYTPIMSLSARSPATAGAAQVNAPFGIAVPDSARRGVITPQDTTRQNAGARGSTPARPPR